MKYFAAAPLAASLVAAQMSVMSLAPAPAGPQTHTVTVGGMKAVSTGMAPVLGYSPENIQAAVGDKVKFIFMQKNHTVTQSTFQNPCKKMENGIDSGFKPNPDGAPGVEFEMTVNNTDPMWFYCRQQNGIHCGKGMVMAINAKEETANNFANYKQNAIGQNGTGTLTTAAIAQVGATAAAAPPQAVTVVAGGGGGGGAGAAAASGGAAPAAASVAAGQGTTGDGQACSCQCLCGMNSFPQNAAQGNFGGFPGEIV